MEIERIAEIEQATGVNRKEVLRLGVSVLFLAGIILYVSSRGEVSPMLIIAGMIGGTVPVSGLLAAMLFFMIRGMMLPWYGKNSFTIYASLTQGLRVFAHLTMRLALC